MYGTHLEDKKICIEIGVDRKIEDFRQNIYSCFMPVLKNTMILLPTYATVLWIFFIAMGPRVTITCIKIMNL